MKLGKLKHIEYTFSPKYNGNMIRCNVDVKFTFRRTCVVILHGVYDEIWFRWFRRNCVVKPPVTISKTTIRNLCRSSVCQFSGMTRRKWTEVQLVCT